MERMRVISTAWYIEAEDLIGGIRSKRQQTKLEDTIPLVDGLEIGSIFEDKAKEGGDSVIDLLSMC